MQFAYSLVHVPYWRREIFEDVYGSYRRIHIIPTDDCTCEEWCMWLRKAMAELQAIEDGNFEQRYGFTLKPAIDELRNEIDDIVYNHEMVDDGWKPTSRSQSSTSQLRGVIKVNIDDIYNHPPIFRLAIRDM